MGGVVPRCVAVAANAGQGMEGGTVIQSESDAAEIMNDKSPIKCDRPGCDNAVDEYGLLGALFVAMTYPYDGCFASSGISGMETEAGPRPNLCESCTNDAQAWWTEVLRHKDTRSSFGRNMVACACCSDHHCRWCGLPMTQAGCSTWRCGHVRHGLRMRVRMLNAKLRGNPGPR